jgi:hypothetical protein
MRWSALVTILAIVVLVGCGGSDKAATSTTTTSGSTTGAPTTAAGAAPTANGAVATSADSDVQDVHVPLAVGSSGEAPSSDPDPMTVNDTQSTVKVTVVAITDNAKTDSPIFQPEAGMRYWAMEVKMEGTGDKTVNTGVWTLHATDGKEYETVYLTGVGDDIIYGALAAGETKQGVIVFQIPSDAVVRWVHMNPSIYLTPNLYFDAP